MYRKCYPIITDFIAGEVEDQSSFGEKWHPLCHICDGWYAMLSNLSGKIRLAPLEILRFPLLAPRKLLDAQKFNIRYTDPSQITEIADKLRWYRYQHALMQKEVAEQIGIDRNTYIHYEEYGRDYYPIEHMEKLAGLYGVPVEDLLDEYNLFLYKGQGEQIQKIRQGLGLTQKQYAERLGVPLDHLKKWEQNHVRIYKSTWRSIFR
ncbi:MAG: helix-turn-helix domain-containing protein [Anaerovoracaceae bacterium]|nr:helix-turn-helix domain-containing protein [Anaerovoracaceae bacterium]